MAISNYSELIAMVGDVTLRPDAPIANFISLVESELFPTLKHIDGLKTITVDIVDNKVAIPADFIEIRNAQIDDLYTRPLGISSPIKLRPNEVGYVNSGTHFEIVTDKQKPKKFTLQYWARPLGVSPDNPTNWVLTKFPNVYVSAVSARVFRWARDLEGEQLEMQALGQALGVVAADNARQFTMIPVNIQMEDSNW
ncbi:phage adaptor protein [Agrobacterium tumefaciens]|uniref:phage adaptor protein n=1 Tax=Agrobacterium tumefaciens TaxID=358 RepID=UPI001573CD1B|nr:hypothetical protein [Agrobacterium tumefaciens]WCJ63809.1 hypothetical protein G6M15_06340 [Agrobacterium tumefaciens]